MIDSRMVTADSVLATTLTGQEQAELTILAAELASTSPQLVDEPAWVDAARRLSSRLPLRLRVAIREFRHDPGDDGLLLIRNLLAGEASLPPTPTAPESVERSATKAAAMQVLIALQIGEIVAFRDEKSGALVQNVVPVRGREDAQSNAGSTLLEMHTENAFHANRPDFVAFFCLRSDHENRAGLYVSSVRRAAALLPDSVKRLLAEPRFVTEPPPSFGDVGCVTMAHAVLDGDPEDPNVLVDFTSTHPLDGDARRAMTQLKNAFNEVSRTLVLRAGELALVDNRLAIHGRTAFLPRYDGRDRWLHRTFIQLDYRRSRAARSGNGHVLV